MRAAGGNLWAPLPPRTHLSHVPGPGKEGAGTAPAAGGAGRGGDGAPGAGWSLSQRLARSRLPLKWVKSLPCTNTGLSPAPPKYTESRRPSWPQDTLLGLCLLLPRGPGFHARWVRGPGGMRGGSCRFSRVLPAAAPTPSAHLCPAGMRCPLCLSHCPVSSSPTAPSQSAVGAASRPAAQPGCGRWCRP